MAVEGLPLSSAGAQVSVGAEAVHAPVPAALAVQSETFAPVEKYGVLSRAAQGSPPLPARDAATASVRNEIRGHRRSVQSERESTRALDDLT